MIFGFNTEVKHGETVYHIQSEARQKDQLLQTQVFIKGRCVGKHASSFADRAASDFTDEHMHQLLKEQHRNFVVAAREGRIDQMLDPHPRHEQPAAVQSESQPAAVKTPPGDTDPLDLT